MSDTSKSITDMMQIHGVDEDERQKMLSNVRKEIAEQKKPKFFDATEFHAKDTFTQQLNEKIVVEKTTRTLKMKENLKQQALLLAAQQKEQQLMDKKFRRSHIFGAIGTTLTAVSIYFAYQATNILYTAYQNDTPLNVNLLQHAFNNSLVGLILVAVAVIIFFAVINLADQISSWWLNFICFAFIATQTILIGYNLLVHQNVINTIF